MTILAYSRNGKVIGLQSFTDDESKKAKLLMEEFNEFCIANEERIR